MGEEFVQLEGYLHNTSASSLEVVGIAVDGPGLGSVIEILDIKIAPMSTVSGSMDVVPGGIFRSYPPAFFTDRGCTVQSLVEIGGFVMAAGQEARIALLQRAAQPGTFRILGYVVTYRQAGGEGTQLISVGERGSVAMGGEPVPPILTGERACREETRLLPPLRSP